MATGSPWYGPLQFRLGVAQRFQFDSSGGARTEDFQQAAEAWTRALASNPNQYIWRRRIQQYGPGLDKPYPFYDWVTQARDAIEARGEALGRVIATDSGRHTGLQVALQHEAVDLFQGTLHG